LERKQILDRLAENFVRIVSGHNISSMAYRAAEHETTENTPNYMILGREVTTPLDIQYCMPRSIAHIPQNRWAWILKDRMEAECFPLFHALRLYKPLKCKGGVHPNRFDVH
jgi:hypothetical protein